MLWLIGSVLLFGIIYPGGKYFISLGISTIDFCIAYLLVRVLGQFVMVGAFSSWKSLKLPSTKELIVLGVIGLSVNIFEFKGLELGMPVSVNAFIVFSHPLWGLLIRLLFLSESVPREKIIRTIVGFCGIGIILAPGLNHQFTFESLVYPILGAIGLASWIIYSERFLENDDSPLGFGLVYDLATLIAIWLVSLTFDYAPNSVVEAFKTLSISDLALFVLFSIFAGIFPNLLAYKGIRICGGVTASLFLLMEPVIATILALFINLEYPTWFTVFGGAVVLLSNIPLKYPKGAIID